MIVERLREVLRAACEDALFVVAGDSLRALEVLPEHRGAAYEALARGEPAVTMRELEAWLAALTRATAGDVAPWFLPMRRAIEDGMTLHRAPRGFRAVIPIGVEESRARIRRDGMFAVRVAHAVAAADGPATADESRALELLLAALGLADEDANLLRAEAPVPVAAMELPMPLEHRTARQILAGAWHVAGADGFDDAERDAVRALASRLALDDATLDEVRVAESAAISAQRALGRAMVDVVRYQRNEPASPLAIATAQLAVPSVDRADVLRMIATNATTPLAESHDLERSERERVLAVAWITALVDDPSLADRAARRARHEHAATHLGAARQAESAREAVEGFVDGVLARAARIVGA